MSENITVHPICPVCNEVMVPHRIERHDGSGWMFGWSCRCTAEMREGVEFAMPEKKEEAGMDGVYENVSMPVVDK